MGSKLAKNKKEKSKVSDAPVEVYLYAKDNKGNEIPVTQESLKKAIALSKDDLIQSQYKTRNNVPTRYPNPNVTDFNRPPTRMIYSSDYDYYRFQNGYNRLMNESRHWPKKYHKSNEKNILKDLDDSKIKRVIRISLSSLESNEEDPELIFIESKKN